MKRERELARRIQSLTSLSEAIGAMKDLSAHHFREIRAAIEPARTYREGVEAVVSRTASRMPAGSGPSGLVLIGADLGLCGAYNGELARSGAWKRHGLGPGATFVVGHRVKVLLARMGVTAEQTYPAPAGPRGIPALLLRLAEDLLRSYVEKDMASLEIVSARFEGVGRYQAVSTRLLPTTPTGGGEMAVNPYVSASHIEGVAVREHLYITIYDLLLDALAAEHSARLAATQSAAEWLDRNIERVRRHWTSARREASTQEVIEVAVGARARNWRTALSEQAAGS